MAKGSSVFATEMLIEEDAGEYRRTMARSPRSRAKGTRDADEVAPMGNGRFRSLLR
jgi:hypothetical protein